MAGEILADLMLEAASAEVARSAPMELRYGTVASVSPLTVRVEGEERLTLSEEFLIVSALCREARVTGLGHAHAASGGQTGEALGGGALLWRGLQAGDRVRMLRAGGGQLYYLLERA